MLRARPSFVLVVPEASAASRVGVALGEVDQDRERLLIFVWLEGALRRVDVDGRLAVAENYERVVEEVGFSTLWSRFRYRQSIG